MLSGKIIPNLDGLRGLSIFLVMLHHIPPLTHPIALNLQQNGRLGVMLFFVISGFLITHLALIERRLTGSFHLKDFYIRRGLRIFPLYYAVLGAVCFLVYALNVYPADVKQAFSERLMSYLFYYSNLTGPIQGPYSLLWSLAVEEQFYLFFALVFFSLPTPLSRTLFFCLAAARLMMPLWGSYFADDRLILMAFRYQEAILLGVSLAYLFENPTFYKKFSALMGNFWALSILFMIISVGLLGFSIQRDPWLETSLNVLFTLLIGAAATMPPIIGLGGPLLSYVGKISYGIYLYHTIVFYGVKRYVSDESLAVFFVGVPLTIIVASTSYEYFELYFLKMKKRFNPS